MKLTFTERIRTNVPMNPEQQMNREAQPTGTKAGPVVAVAGAIILVVVLAVWWWRSMRVYTYGVVATGLEAFLAPVRSKVLSVYVEPGDRVKADQVLFLLVSEDAAAEMSENQELLAQQQRILEVAVSQEGSLFADPIQELRDLNAAQLRLRLLEDERPQLELKMRAESLWRQGEHASARRLAEHLAVEAKNTGVYRMHIADLRSLDAASADQLRAAETAERQARFAADDAAQELAQKEANVRLAEELAAGGIAAHGLALEQASAYLADMKSTYHDAKDLREKEKDRGIENIRSRIASLESRIAHLRTLAGPTEVRSLADGVVTEVIASEGSNVPKDGIILTVAGTGKVWINAFVPPERAKEVKVGDVVAVYPTTGTRRLSGTITASGGIQYKVHPALQSRISETSAVYVRIDLDELSPELIPGNVAQVVIH